MEEQKPISDISVIQPDDMPPLEMSPQVNDIQPIQAASVQDISIKPEDKPSAKPSDKKTKEKAQVTLKPKTHNSQKTTMVVVIVLVMIALIALSLLAYSKGPHS